MRSYNNLQRRVYGRALLLIAVMTAITIASARRPANAGSYLGQANPPPPNSCGGATSIVLPFNDVIGSFAFCQIAAAYFTGLTNGTSATTYGPSDGVTREQMAAFITRTMSQGLRRGSRRAALGRWDRPPGLYSAPGAFTGDLPKGVRCDGADLWVAVSGWNTVERIRASDGERLGTWTQATAASDLTITNSRIFIAGNTDPGKLYFINRGDSATNVATFPSNLPAGPHSITFDGTMVWTANQISISQIDPFTGAHADFPFTAPRAIIFDGRNLWLTQGGGIDTITKLDLNGTPIMSLPTGGTPSYPVYDGINIWVPNFSSNSVTVIRVSDSFGNPVEPVVIRTLIGNGLNGPLAAAFDGERVMVTNNTGNSVSQWRATDLAQVGVTFINAPTNQEPYMVCSDGLNFWVTFNRGLGVFRF